MRENGLLDFRKFRNEITTTGINIFAINRTIRLQSIHTEIFIFFFAQCELSASVASKLRAQKFAQNVESV